MFSSQTDGEKGAETEDEGQEVKSEGGKLKKERLYPSLVDSLAICYMGIMLLRIPISLGDIYRSVA